MMQQEGARVTILSVDPCGTALVLEEFGSAISRGGSESVIGSMSRHCRR